MTAKKDEAAAHTSQGASAGGTPATVGIQHVSRQHVVSQVLLKQFAVPRPKSSGLQLIKFDLDYPERSQKPKSPRACGWVEDFVRIESASAENLWGRVEQEVPPTLMAVHDGTVFNDPKHAETLRNLIAVHMVRSHRYHKVHHNAFSDVYKRLRTTLLRNNEELLRVEALRETGLHLPGPHTLGAYLDRIMENSTPTKDHKSGRLFRNNIEEMFDKIRFFLAKFKIEIIAPESGAFIIGDNPAITMRHDGTYNMAIGDAHTVVLPIGPKHLIALGPNNLIGSIPKSKVDDLNKLQAIAANRHVFFRPDSETEKFVREVCRYRPKHRSTEV
ncbi:DUF4238 domain-containing protein [Streptosporangium sp. NPDC006007]|uniref:DUF4238 domain-containing protein n=1 Tax=Streptosporangium sp. NPDC006007 TaxID=3154575 RepID=UPI0033B440DC